MGHGISEVSAIAGFKVSVVDISWDFLNRAKERINDSLNRLFEKGSIKEKPYEVMNRIEFSTSYEVMKDADFVIEAVPEIIELKRKVFQTLDDITPKQSILASNTSSIPISNIAEVTKRPEKVIGMHFFNPHQS